MVFPTEAPGTYNIFIVNYTGQLSSSLTGSVYLQRWSDGCFRISANEIIVRLDEPNAGDITTVKGETLVYVCAGDGASDFVGFDNPGAANVDYAYVVTTPSGEVLGVPAVDFQDFEGAGVGDCRVYGVSFTGDLDITVGENIASSALATGCADLSSSWLTVSRSMTNGGSLTFNGSMDQVSLDDNSASDVIDFDVSGQSMSSTSSYFLVDSDHDILAISSDTEFDLSSYPAGKYFIYGMNYSGALRLVVGDDLFDTPKRAEGCSDFSGNAIVVKKSSGATDGGGDGVCSALAGGLLALNPVDTIEVDKHGVSLEVTVSPQPVVPTGYEVRYLLLSAKQEFFVVADVYTSLNEAYVNNTNTYGLVTIVGEFSDPSDPNYFDIDGIQQGSLNILDLRNQLVRSGVCFNLSSQVTFEIARRDDTPTGCTISAGTLASNEVGYTPDNSAILSASVVTVPTDFEGCTKIYILTEGDNLNIINASTSPIFEVGADGDFRIHTLIANQSDLGLITTPRLFALLSGGGALTGPGLSQTLTDFGFCFDLSSGTSFTTAGLDASGQGGSACLANADFSLAPRTIVFDGDSVSTGTNFPMSTSTVPVGSSEIFVLSDANGNLLEVGYTTDFRVATGTSYSINACVNPDLINDQLIDYLNGLASDFGGLISTDLLIGAIASSGLCASYDPRGVVINAEDSGDLQDGSGVTFIATQQGAGSNVNVRITATEGAPQAGEVTVRLVDYSGRTISARTVPNAAAASTVELPTQSSTGLHAVSVRTATGIESQNVVVQ